MAQYATADDLAEVGVSSDRTADIPTATITGVLTKRSAYADGFLVASGRITLPLTAWGDDLRIAVAQLAAWDIMTAVLGMSPDDAANTNWMVRRDEAQRWLERVASGLVVPVGIVDSTPTETETGFAISTCARRGW